MKLETENVKETEASAELIRELMADDVRRGNWLIPMHDDDEEAFMQIAFDRTMSLSMRQRRLRRRLRMRT